MMHMQAILASLLLFALGKTSAELVIDAACGVSIGCFHDCDSNGQSCNFLVTWVDEGTNVKFEIKTEMPTVSTKWFAVGFSTNRAMGSDSVTECVVENTTSFGGSVYHSYNTGYTNERLQVDSGLGISNSSLTHINGVFTCVFYQEKAPAASPSEIFDLNTNWYILYAYGELSAAGVKQQHSLDPEPPSTSGMVNFTQFQVFQAPRPAGTGFVLDPLCGDLKGCFHDCDEHGQHCTFMVIWVDKGVEVEIKIKTLLPTPAEKWFAVGFSDDRRMQADSVTECVIENTTEFEGGVYHSYNDDTGHDNHRLTANETLGIRVEEFKLVNGIFTCEFYQTKTIANAPSEIFDLTKDWYILYAYGDMNGGVKQQHILDPEPPSTPEKVNFTQAQVFQAPRATGTGLVLDPLCNETKGCFHDCDEQGQQCTFMVIWVDKGVEVEIKIKTLLPTVTEKWFAVGFSTDRIMQADSVTECVIENTTVFGGDVYHSYNANYDHSNHRLSTNEKLGIRLAEFKLVNGIFTCEFYQTKTPANAPSEIFDLTKDWYIMYAYGDMNGGVKQQHSLDPEPPSTPEKVNFAQTQMFQAPRPAGTGLVLDPLCGDTKGCLHDCDEQGQGCTFMVIWVDKGVEVEIKIKTLLPTVTEKWFAVGFSDDRRMQADSVTECVIENTDEFGGGVYHSYNDDTGHDNHRLTANETLGIRVEEFKLVDGIFTCEFYQTKTIANAPSEIFDLTSDWYILYAYGDMSGGQKQRHSLDPEPPSTPEKVNFAQTQVFQAPRPAGTGLVLDPLCGDTKGCLHDCDGQGQGCTFMVIWVDEGLEVEIKIKTLLPTVAKKWFAVGFSEDMKMKADSVTECVIENTDVFGGSVYHSYNEDTGHDNHRLTANETLGIRVAEFKLENGIFTCEFYQTKAPANAPSEIFDLTDDWYILYAYGDMIGDTKRRHSLDPEPISTPERVDFTRTQVFATVSAQTFKDPGCGTSKGCFHNCDTGKPCDFQVSWKDTGDGSIDFSIKARSSGTDRKWFSVGFSTDDKMGSDSVTECVMLSSGEVEVYRSWNEAGEKDNHRLRANEKLGINVVSYSLENGVFICSFKQEKNPAGSTSEMYNLEEDWVLLYAYGPVQGENGKSRHSLNPEPLSSGQKVDLQIMSDLGAEEGGIEAAVKAHAILMIVGIIFSASIGIVIARYYKPVWQGRACMGKDVWFQLHRTVMILAFLCMAAGFIIIFVEEGEWVEIHGTNFQKAHPFCGVVAMAFFLINPVMALFRCSPGDKNRQYFNWAHWFVGTTGHILGVLTIFMGIGMEELGIPNYTLYILIAYVVYQFVVELILECHQCFAEGKGKGRSAAYELRDTKGRQLSDVPSDSHTPMGSGFKRAVIYLHILIVAGFAIAVAVIIGIQ